jgi:peptide-methionine (S)-S-oxide reductase
MKAGTRKEKIKTEKAVFGAGCFWHVEAAFRKVEGVINATVGYMGGNLKNPSYEDVCSHKTGHAEVCLVEFDPEKVSYKELLDAFWKIHNPTQLNRQGLDIGDQYRSVIFYFNEKQRRLALSSKEEKQKRYKQVIVTQIVPAKTFYRAEEYHQRYFEKNKMIGCGLV